MIRKCTCKSEFQDERYGEKMRVWNLSPSPTSGGKVKCRCTICGAEEECLPHGEPQVAAPLGDLRGRKRL